MKRILIVDDAIDLGRLFQDALKTAHPEIPVTVVPSGEEALLESTRYAFDLLVTDIRLPGMTGLDLIRKIRVRQPNIFVIVITGILLDERLKKQKDDLGPEVFMRKPIGVNEFLDEVDRLLGFSEEKALPEPAPVVVEEPKETKKKAQAATSRGAAKTDPDPVKTDLLDELAGVFPGEPVQSSKKTAPLKKGTGSLVQMAPPQTPSEEGLSGILSRLRGTLGAHSTILLDERGHPVAQAGDMPDLALETQLVPPMMASLSAGAKISYLLGSGASQMVHAYRGVTFDLVVAPVGQYALFIAIKPGRSALRLALAFEEALQAQAELSVVLEGMGLHVQSVAEVGAPETLAALAADEETQEAEIPPEILETPLGQDPGLEKFEALFSKKKTGQLRLQDADSFWDTAAVPNDENELSSSGFLSFEQAQKLGLFPTEEEH